MPRKALMLPLLLSLGLFVMALTLLNNAQAQIFGIGGFLNPEGSRLIPQPFILPRRAGKPDLRWKIFNWNFTDIDVSSGKYRLYFYPEEKWTAQLAIPKIDSETKYLQQIFHYKPTERFSYLLFNSQRDFQQANIFDISEGVEGITSTTEATMAIPYWGEVASFDHVSTHEMTHQFQFQKVKDSAGNDAQTVLSNLPLWFVEGMAEYYSLHGVDPESRVYIRDLLLHPNPKEDYKMPAFFEEGIYNFIFVYKVGQAKNDFLDSYFGKGTIQKVLELASHAKSENLGDFKAVVSKATGKSVKEIEEDWKTYLKQYRSEADKLTDSFKSYEVLPGAGNSLDSFALSEDGKSIAFREINPLTGVTSIQLMDTNQLSSRTPFQTEVIHDRQAKALSLYFFQAPVLALSNHWIAYVALTVAGPEMEIRSYQKNSQGNFQLGLPHRIKLHLFGMTQAESLTISPHEDQLAFVGLDKKGWQNVYVVSLADSRLPTQDTHTFQLKQLTHDYFSWKNLHWEQTGILGASDATPDAVDNIFQLDPKTGEKKQITFSKVNQLSPDGEEGHFVFQSWEGGSSQIHFFLHGEDIRITAIQTEFIAPQFRQGNLYALGFKGGRYQLYRVPGSKLNFSELEKESVRQITQIYSPQIYSPPIYSPWTPNLAQISEEDILSYRPFVTSGIRVDNLSGFIATGNALGVSAIASDLMRNYSVSADAFIFRQVNISDFDLFLTRQAGRTKWTVGPYQIVQPRLDDVFPSETFTRSYLYHEVGGLATMTYPFGPFSHADFELRTGSVDRTDYNDPSLAPAWNALNPGNELIVAPMLRWGYDNILYETYSGPLKGFSTLLESDTSIFPHRSAVTERLRLDIGYYWELSQTMVLGIQGLAGAAFAKMYSDPFFVSSDDILRAYPAGDPRLQGNYVLASNLEFRFPIGTLFKFPPFRGLLATDLGSISQQIDTIGQGVTSSATVGLSLNIPPLTLNLMNSVPIRTALSPMSGFVFHFTLRYLYF